MLNVEEDRNEVFTPSLTLFQALPVYHPVNLHDSWRLVLLFPFNKRGS